MNDNLPVENPAQLIEEAARHPKNLGEMESADAIGTVGRSDCGDMLRMWVKFKEEDGRRVIDRATFQTFGCQTAIAVASVATEMIRGKTSAEALSLSGEQLSSPLGPLPPMKIHCAQLVEDALRSALDPAAASSSAKPASKHPSPTAPSLSDQLSPASGKVKITLI
jgi:NifU-like protein involved in Fe-S cluster formation